MKVYIENMVCQGTRQLLLLEFGKLGIAINTFGSGEIEFKKDLSASEIEKLDHSFEKIGLKARFSLSG
jgi:hypothetical protein